MIDKIQKALLVQLNTNIGSGKFRVDYSTAPEPNDTYGTVGVTSATQKHRGEQRFESANDRMYNEVLETFVVLVTVHTYGRDAYPLAEEARSLFKFQDIREELLSQDIATIDSSMVRRLPDRRDTQYVSHASFEIHLYTRMSYRRYMDWFNKVRIHEEISNQANKVVVDTDLEVKTQQND